MLRFTIRDVLWLTAVVALAIAWWSQKINLAKEAVSWKHRATAVRGMLESRGWDTNWDGDTIEFQNGPQLITCPQPQPGQNYTWHNEWARSN